MTTLSIVIPAYNEEDGIANIMRRVLAVRESLARVGVDDLELLVVDDGSRDKTVEIASQVAGENSGVRIISHPRNRGYGAALKTGFSQSSGEWIGFLDADGTYPPEYFPKLFQETCNGWDLVIGSRMAGEASEMPPVRRLGNWLFANWISLLGRHRITDSASGMRIFKRQILEQILPLPDGLNLTPIMSTRAIHEGVRMTEVPIPYSERVGRSKLSAIRDGSVYLQTITWTVLTYNPVRILGIIGLISVIISAIVALGLVAARLSGITTLPAWGVAALFAAMVLAVSGVSFFALGATFNYLVTLFYHRPIRQGLFGKPVMKQPVERHFGWIGLAAFGLGMVVGITSLVLGLNGWEVQRLWLYLLGSAMMILVGIQLVIYWLLMRVLAELSQREMATQQDLGLS
jgi:glycosyltransferase involved in cell wall biosynthesis